MLSPWILETLAGFWRGGVDRICPWQNAPGDGIGYLEGPESRKRAYERLYSTEKGSRAPGREEYPRGAPVLSQGVMRGSRVWRGGGVRVVFRIRNYFGFSVTGFRIIMAVEFQRPFRLLNERRLGSRSRKKERPEATKGGRRVNVSSEEGWRSRCKRPRGSVG